MTITVGVDEERCRTLAEQSQVGSPHILADGVRKVDEMHAVIRRLL